MSITEELEKLTQMHENGALSDEEFEQAKGTLLNSASAPSITGGFLSASAPREEQVRQWAMLLHLSLLAGYLVPLAGLIAPILIWQLKKNDLPELDVHGKIAANWIISSLIYGVIGFLLVFVFIGFLVLLAVGIMGVVFPVIASIKANNGETWRYPMSIEFYN